MSSEDEEIVYLDGRSISAGGAFRIKYSSTNKATETGSSWRTVLAERPGTVAETQFGKASDTSPGWWMHHNGALKFFVDRRLIIVVPVTPQTACRYDDCPQQLRDAVAAAGAVDRGASPARARSGSRSRSRSRSRSPVPLSRNSPLF